MYVYGSDPNSIVHVAMSSNVEFFVLTTLLFYVCCDVTSGQIITIFQCKKYKSMLQILLQCQ